MTITKIRDLANDRNIHLQNLHDGDLWAINSGFDNLDRKTGKFRSGDLVVIGARPVMGRSTFAENLVYNIAKHNDPHHNVLFFSMETPSATIVDKFATKISDIDPWKLRVGMLKDADIKSLEQATAEIAKLPILVDDTTHFTMPEFVARIHKTISEQALNEDLGAVVIDHLDLLLPYDRTSADYEQKLDEVTHGLRDLARELEIPIILMLELPRYINEGDPTPTLPILKPYGSLERDASIIIFLHRPSYYDTSRLDYPDAQTTELIIRKNLHGPIKTVKIRFDPDKLKFVSLDDNA